MEDSIAETIDKAPAASAESAAASTARRAILIIVLVAGIALRLVWNNVADYSPADETVYRNFTQFLVREGLGAYPRLVKQYLTIPAFADYPSPIRYGHFALTTSFCRLVQDCDYRTLASLSMLAGIAMLGVAYALGSRIGGPWTGAVAVAFTAAAPLQLALSRRALQDEVVGVVVVGALVLVLAVRDHATGLRLAAAVAALALTLAMKEASILFWPAMIAAFIPGRRRLGWRDATLFVAPIVVWIAGFLIVAGSLSDFVGMLSAQKAALARNAYAAQYQSGPPHRLLFDFLILSPGIWLLAVGGAAILVTARRGDDVEPRRILLFLAVALAAFVPMTYNARYLIAVDAVLHVFAAWALVHAFAPQRRRAVVMVVLVAVTAAIELTMFVAIFLAGRVYDPTTFDVLRALNAVPR